MRRWCGDPCLSCVLPRIFMSDSRSKNGDQPDADLAKGGRGGHQPKKLPPVPLWSRAELDLPSEIGGELGIILWQRVRAVKLWGSTLRTRMKHLFSGLASKTSDNLALVAVRTPDIADAVGVLTGVVTSPDTVEVTEIVEACHHIVAWADERGWVETALRYAEAAAIADPNDPAAAATAGQFCTRATAVNRATVWLYRSMELARRSKSREWQIRSRLRLGSLLFQLGEYVPARKLFLTAYNMSLRSGRRILAAQAQHDLLTLASDRETYGQGELHAWEALRLYPIYNPRVAPLAHDYAFLLTRHQHFIPALAILKAALPLVQKPHERITVLATLARAAAAVADRRLFDEARTEAISIAATSEERAAAAFVRLAEGWWSMGEQEQAEQMARKAIDIANRRNEAEPRRLAYALLEDLACRGSSDRERSIPEGSRVDVLVRRFLFRLRKQKTSAPA
jgi:tetratricopeptide (TPR) repeat protein